MFKPLPGTQPDLATIIDTAAEFTLTGLAAQAIQLNEIPEQIDDYTFRYAFTGQFGTGPVTVDFLADAFADSEGNLSRATTETFTVVGPTANMLVAAVDLQAVNRQGYLDVWFKPSRDGTLDEASITDAAREFTLSGLAAAGVTVDGAAVAQGDGHTYRYYFTGQFCARCSDRRFPGQHVHRQQPAGQRGGNRGADRHRRGPCWRCRRPACPASVR